MFDKSLPWIRRVLSVLVLIVLILSPIMQLLRIARQDPFPYPESPVIVTDLSRNFLLHSDHFVRELLDPIYKDVSGGPYVLKFYPVTFSEPLSITTNAVNRTFYLETWNLTMVISLVIALGLALLFGRVYCGYICPMSIVSSLNQRLQQKLLKRTFRTSGSLSSKLSSTGEPVFIFVLFVIVITNPIILQYIQPPSLFQHGISDYLIFGGWTLWLTLLVGLMVFELFRPGYFCRRLCPTGLFLTILGQKKVVHLQHSKGIKCPTQCTECIDSCWLGLNPKGNIKNSACDLCVRCAAHCPTGRIKFLGAFLAVLLCFQSDRSYAGIFDNKEDYHGIISERTFEEGEFSLKKSGGGTLKVFYSFWGKTNAPQNAGKMHLYIHILDGKKIFVHPVTISQLKNKKIVAKVDLDTVTHPISIGQRSLYRYGFEFRARQKYRFLVSSLENLFQSFEILFRYPKSRF